MSEFNDFTAVLVIKAFDWPIAMKTIPFIKKNLRPKHVVVVSAMELKDKLPDDDYISFLCEDDVYSGMSLESVRNMLSRVGGPAKWAGWYLQQFIKLSYSYFVEDEYYLAWDMDTIPTRKIDFFDEKSGRPFFNMKPEYFSAYFSTIENLFGYRKVTKESFITEHMLFKTSICREIIEKIEADSQLSGNNFCERIINVCDFNIYPHSFSEYETYGTYVSKNYPGLYLERHLRTFRSGRLLLGDCTHEEVIKWAGRSFDTISFESWNKPINIAVKICNNPIVRHLVSFEFVAKMFYRCVFIIGNVLYIVTRNKGYKAFIEKIRGCFRQDYFFSKEPWYQGEIDE